MLDLHSNAVLTVALGCESSARNDPASGIKMNIMAPLSERSGSDARSSGHTTSPRTSTNLTGEYVPAHDRWTNRFNCTIPPPCTLKASEDDRPYLAGAEITRHPNDALAGRWRSSRVASS